jgi:hypothetical protein
MVDGAMNKVIEQLDNGDFKVVSTSYDIPVKYHYNSKLRKQRLDNRKHTSHTAGYSYKYSFYRDNGC